MNIGMETLNKLELDWLRRLHRNRSNPSAWQMHDCPNAIVIVFGDSAWKFSGSISKFAIVAATIIVLALTALLSLFIYMVVDFYCVACMTVIIIFKMILNTNNQNHKVSTSNKDSALVPFSNSEDRFENENWELENDET